uniref:Uncharacterized protein n=1 Tax=Panagrolaimus superbus TaxID=310955 RepID=A0A914Y5B9_9BILA
MDETTLAELKDIKALLSGTKSEIQICQETQTMPPPSPQTPNLLGQPSPFMYSSTKDAHDQFFNSRPVGVFDAALNGGIPRKDVSKNSSQQTIDEHYASAAIATDPQCTNAFELQQELNESIPNIDLTSMNMHGKADVN